MRSGDEVTLTRHTTLIRVHKRIDMRKHEHVRAPPPNPFSIFAYRLLILIGLTFRKSIQFNAMKIFEAIINFIRGGLVGMAELVPGVSGGTIALVTGIYERVLFNANRLLDAAKAVPKDRPLPSNSSAVSTGSY